MTKSQKSTSAGLSKPTTPATSQRGRPQKRSEVQELIGKYFEVVIHSCMLCDHFLHSDKERHEQQRSRKKAAQKQALRKRQAEEEAADFEPEPDWSKSLQQYLLYFTFLN
jgi:hypothetical protein